MPEPKSDKEKFYLIGKAYSHYITVSKILKKDLKFTLIAPFEGTLIESYTTEGSLVSPGQKIGTFINSNLFDFRSSCSIKIW